MNSPLKSGSKIIPADAVHVMIDLETLGLAPGCKILEIGAAVIGKNGTEPIKSFFVRAHPNLQGELVANPKTVDWWSNQKNFANVMSGTASLFDTLTRFAEWLGALEGTPVVWGNAASFDLKILEHAYKHFGIPVPWSYKHEMCYRTLKNLFEEVPVPENLNAHDALGDAVNQAIHAAQIFQYAGLFGFSARLGSCDTEGYDGCET